MTWARQRRAAGASLRRVVEELGISHEPLRCWMKRGQDTFPRVEVVEARTSPGLVVVLPSGARIEGLGRDDLVAVLRGLS